MDNTIVGIDLAKQVIQICIIRGSQVITAENWASQSLNNGWPHQNWLPSSLNPAAHPTTGNKKRASIAMMSSFYQPS